MIDQLIAEGKKSRGRIFECEKSGGHFKDRETTTNNKRPAWGCRCGFVAPADARIWLGVFAVGDPIFYTRHKAGGYFDDQYKGKIVRLPKERGGRIGIEYYRYGDTVKASVDPRNIAPRQK